MSNVGPVATCPGAADDNLLGVFIYTVMPTAFRAVSRRYRIKSAEIDSRRVTDRGSFTRVILTASIAWKLIVAPKMKATAVIVLIALCTLAVAQGAASNAVQV